MEDRNFANSLVVSIIIAAVVIFIAWLVGSSNDCDRMKCPSGLYPQLVRTSLWNRYETKCVCVGVPEAK